MSFNPSNGLAPGMTDSQETLLAKQAQLLYNAFGGGAAGGGAAWGSITGTLSNQTDLNTALGLRTLNSAAAITGGTITGLTGLAIRSTGAAFDLTFATSEALSAGRTLSFNVANANRTLTIPATGTVALLGTANVFTAGQSITEPVGSSALTITGATQTSNFPVINATQTWNAVGTAFKGISLVVTNTASAANSDLISLTTAAGATFRACVKVGTYGSGILFGNTNAGANRYPFIGQKTVGGITYILGGSDENSGVEVMEWAMNQTAAAFRGTVSLGAALASQDVILSRKAAASLQLGADANGTPVNQTLAAASGITGTDRPGANLTFDAGNCTGAGAPGDIIFRTSSAGASGTTPGTYTPRLYIEGTTGLLQFGAQNSTAPALKGAAGSTLLSCRVADDSDYADFACKSLTIDGTVTVGVTTGATAGPYTTITSITVVGGIVTDLQGS